MSIPESASCRRNASPKASWRVRPGSLDFDRIRTFSVVQLLHKRGDHWGVGLYNDDMFILVHLTSCTGTLHEICNGNDKKIELSFFNNPLASFHVWSQPEWPQFEASLNFLQTFATATGAKGVCQDFAVSFLRQLGCKTRVWKTWANVTAGVLTLGLSEIGKAVMQQMIKDRTGYFALGKTVWSV